MSDVKLTFKIREDGYDIYREGDPLYEDGRPWISQTEPLIPNKELSYEENAKLQIEQLSKGLNSRPEEEITEDKVEEDIPQT